MFAFFFLFLLCMRVCTGRWWDKWMLKAYVWKSIEISMMQLSSRIFKRHRIIKQRHKIAETMVAQQKRNRNVTIAAATTTPDLKKANNISQRNNAAKNLSTLTHTDDNNIRNETSQRIKQLWLVRISTILRDKLAPTQPNYWYMI